MPVVSKDVGVLQRTSGQRAQQKLQARQIEQAGMVLENRKDAPAAQMEGERMEIADVGDQTVALRGDGPILQRAGDGCRAGIHDEDLSGGRAIAVVHGGIGGDGGETGEVGWNLAGTVGEGNRLRIGAVRSLDELEAITAVAVARRGGAVVEGRDGDSIDVGVHTEGGESGAEGGGIEVAHLDVDEPLTFGCDQLAGTVVIHDRDTERLDL